MVAGVGCKQFGGGLGQGLEVGGLEAAAHIKPYPPFLAQIHPLAPQIYGSERARKPTDDQATYREISIKYFY